MIFKRVIIGIIFAISICKICFTSFASYYYDPVADAYKGGEPDYADGDLEDKLGDSGYYYDLFPEERDGEPDDYEKGIIGWTYDGDPIYKNNNSNSKNGTNYNSKYLITDYINNYKGNATSNETRVISAGLAGDIIQTGDKIYFRHKSGTFHKGWLGLANNKWYYFDPSSLELVKNELKEIDGYVYYFDQYGVMMTNATVEIGWSRVKIDDKGRCQLLE